MHHADHSRPRAGTALDGYRLLRKLGEGKRAEVFLGVAEGEPHSALKVYRPSCLADARAVELEALTRAAHAHVVQVRDVASNSLILERLELGSLAQLLAGRSALSLGEALTILAPLGSAIDSMHDSGVAHGAIGPTTVLFRATGAPVLACFGQAALHEPALTPAGQGDIPGVIDDRAAFARLSATVLATQRDSRVTRLLDWLAEQGEQGFPDAIGEAVAERLFGMADAEPVRFERDDVPSGPAIPARVVSARAVSTDSVPVGASVARRAGLPQWIDDTLAESFTGSLIGAWRERLLAHLRAVRRRVWILAGAVALALVVALLVVPTNDEQPVSSGTTTPAPSETPVVVEISAVTGDDPLEALTALLEVRERCIRELSILCLEGVDQVGSAAMAHDVALVRSLQSDSGEQRANAPLDATESHVVERLGDSALIRLATSEAETGDTQPASLLLMKGEAGWRIRGYLT